MNKIKEDPENEETPAQPLKVIKKVSPTKKTPPGLKKVVKLFFVSSQNQPFSLFHHFYEKFNYFRQNVTYESLKLNHSYFTFQKVKFI